MRYFKVKAKCGHVGRHYFIYKWFYTKAIDGHVAAQKIRNAPRVKHGQKEAISEVIEVTLEDYIQGVKIMQGDSFIQVHNRQDQKIKCLNIDYEKQEEDELITYKRDYFYSHLKNLNAEKYAKQEILECQYE